MNMVKSDLRLIASAVENNNAIAPLEITAVVKNKTAYIGIKGSIYKWNQASSMDVEKVINEAKKEGATKAEVYITTPGGDVFEANEILNLIKDAFKSKNVKVKVGAVCASAGTRFLTDFYSTAKKNSQFMIHKPMGNPSGNEDEIEAGLKLIKNITAEYKTAYAEKMGITEADVEKLWAKGDYWMTAKEALKKGLIDAIEDENEPIDATTRMQLVACGAPIIPQAKSENQNQNKYMELSVLAVSVGLPATATEAQVNAKIAELKKKADTADGLVQAAADKEKADKAAKVKALLDGAEEAKKISAKQRPSLEVMANADFKAAETYIKELQPIDALSDQLTPGTKSETKKGQEKWTYAEFQENDPEAFEKLPEAKQKELIDAHYKE